MIMLNSEIKNIILSKRGMAISFFLLSSLVSLYNFNISIMLILLGAILLANNFGFLEYLCIGLALLIKSQDPNILSSQDLSGYVEVYNEIAKGMDPYDPNNEVFSKGEIILPTFFWLISRIFNYVSIQEMSFYFMLVFLILFYPIVNQFKSKPIIAVSLIIFVDTFLAIHLFRQTLASLFLLLSIIHYLKNKNKLIILLGYILSILTHTTSLLFGIIIVLAFYFSEKMLKILLIISFILGTIIFEKDIFKEFLILISGYEILGKASYALNVFESDYGFRLVAWISAALTLFVKDNKDNNILFRICIIFFALGFLFYKVPILSPRIGLIGTSIITGLPIGILIYNLKLKIIRFLIKEQQ